jgi:glycosyltransferase involved in cell wall biosynthesis
MAGGCLRVLLLNWRDSGHPEGGGAENVIERIAAGLQERGHAVEVHCAHYPGAAVDEVVDGVRFVRRGGRFSVYLRTALTLLRRRHGWDVVVDVQNGVPFWAPLFTRAPVVNLTHHLHREQWQVIFGRALGRVGWWLESALAPKVYRRCRYVTVSEATRSDLARIGVAPERVGVVYSGIDAPVLPLDAHSWPRSAAPCLVVLGRLVPHKRVEVALAALALLRRRWPELTLTVVGQGYWQPALRAEAERLGVADAVGFAGHVDDATKHRLLAEAWLHLMPSVKEGWGLVVVESAAHGTPTVAFRSAGGPTESVRDGETGLLADDVAGFGAALRRLLTDTPLRDGMARAARVHAARFSWPATAAVVEAELRALAGLPARVPATLTGLPPRLPAALAGPTAAEAADPDGPSVEAAG